jgi:hypothetical protein
MNDNKVIIVFSMLALVGVMFILLVGTKIEEEHQSLPNQPSERIEGHEPQMITNGYADPKDKE